MVLLVTTKSATNKAEVQTMFDGFARRYDFFNHISSLYIDRRWRNIAANELKGLSLSKTLDVATGTADMALTIRKRLKPQCVIGVDISEEMLAIGRKKVEKKKQEKFISLQCSDSEALPFNGHTFDAVTVAFGVRNFENLEKGLKEMYRVLKNKGKIVILELSIPKNRIFRKIFNFYFFRVMPLIGRLLAKGAKNDACEYLPNSVQKFHQGTKFNIKMENCGFENVKVKPLTFGIVTIYTGVKS